MKRGNLKAYLGVTNLNSWRKVKAGDYSHWCVYLKYQASKGDYFFLYRTRVGIVQLYTLSSPPYNSEEIECAIRSMLTIDIKLMTTFENPVTASDMRQNAILKKSGALGRNFQQTIFRLSDSEQDEILRQLVHKNPTQARLLKNLME
jgi:predicted RNA-binding protein with PUA-like domain